MIMTNAVSEIETLNLRVKLNHLSKQQNACQSKRPEHEK